MLQLHARWPRDNRWCVFGVSCTHHHTTNNINNHSYNSVELRVSEAFVILDRIDTAQTLLVDAGLREGDAVLSVNGHRFDTQLQFAMLCRESVDLEFECVVFGCCRRRCCCCWCCCCCCCCCWCCYCCCCCCCC